MAASLIAGTQGHAEQQAEPFVTAPVEISPLHLVRVGALRWLGGIELRGGPQGFGGLSGLRWWKGHLLALSDDQGSWFKLRPIERNGRLRGAELVGSARLNGPDGVPLEGKIEADAESLELAPDGKRAYVGFERHDRVWSWALKKGLPLGRPRVESVPIDWLARQPDNLGIEAMAGDRNTTLMISEGLRAVDSQRASSLLFSAGIGHLNASRAREVAVPAPGELRPCDLVQVGPREHVLLRRSYSTAEGFRVAIERLRLSGPAEAPVVTTELLATLAPPLRTDNFEGVAFRHEGGRRMIYLVSDNNFLARQRTLLLKFELPAG